MATCSRLARAGTFRWLGRVSVYRAGETFFEAPHAVHLVSANASDEKPVRFLASFTCDRETPLSVPEP